MKPLLSTFGALLSLFLSSAAFCCQPTEGAKARSLETNFKAAKVVFLGTVAKPSKLVKTKEGRDQYRLSMQVEKIFKGAAKGEIEISAESNTCNPFGQFALQGYKCIVFLDSNEQIISGLLAGESSECWPANTPRLASKIREFEDKIQKLRN